MTTHDQNDFLTLTGTDANVQLYQDLLANKPNFAAPNAVKLNVDSMMQCVRVTG